MSSTTEQEGVMNVFTNGVQPIDIRYGSQVAGVAEFVAAEVFVSYMARWLFKAEKRTLMELATIHAVSVPLIGGLAAPVEPKHILGYEAPVTDLIADGAKGVPAVFAAQFIINTALHGLHAPKLNFTDILMTIGAKVVTRPILSLVYPFLGPTFRTNLDVVDGLFDKQRAASNLRSD